MTEEYKDITSAKVWLSMLSLILVIPCYFCIYGVVVLLGINGPPSHEASHFIAYILLYSCLIWMPQVFVLIYNWKHLSRVFKAIFTTPIAVLLFSFLVAL